ncbi:hypothetical protein JOF56_000021 [Kibdelosporangium banguiense]|uniref:Uncharacterized protein n=1 Tax=Kibdelosporangium banguiense TaxID=1365924 RepID=A0ABS4T593_9PSEU|nr:hypothetical protein [Kibdelosporangium banguiense]MBP2319636.1 hypothetical protein [Kibdelosporangium banguiense]
MTSQENEPITPDPPQPPGTPDPPDLDVDVKKIQRRAEAEVDDDKQEPPD